ncbi:hypothetical protein PR048_022603 [Dryococelus australis]|uniref:Uncharacterized protein n=1 Tax=Dryococelus australis TaxID=614101 RepID=A0ABQ9H1Q9_9NEOP|nr:hypothetical protein PR048_022603 [Dryococelus australis]
MERMNEVICPMIRGSVGGQWRGGSVLAREEASVAFLSSDWVTHRRRQRHFNQLRVARPQSPADRRGSRPFSDWLLELRERASYPVSYRKLREVPYWLASQLPLDGWRTICRHVVAGDRCVQPAALRGTSGSFASTVCEEHQLIGKPEEHFNTDESGLQLNNKPTGVIATKSVKDLHVLTSSEKGENVTVTACCNAEGTFTPPGLLTKSVSLTTCCQADHAEECRKSSASGEGPLAVDGVAPTGCKGKGLGSRSTFVGLRLGTHGTGKRQAPGDGSCPKTVFMGVKGQVHFRQFVQGHGLRKAYTPPGEQRAGLGLFPCVLPDDSPCIIKLDVELTVCSRLFHLAGFPRQSIRQSGAYFATNPLPTHPTEVTRCPTPATDLCHTAPA